MASESVIHGNSWKTYTVVRLHLKYFLFVSSKFYNPGLNGIY